MITPPFSLWDSVVTTIGVESAAKLSDRYRGRKFYIPVRLGIASSLIETVGEEDALRLVEQMAGVSISVPTGLLATRRSRDREILSAISAGERSSVVARKFATSQRNIERIVKKERTTCSQL